MEPGLCSPSFAVMSYDATDRSAHTRHDTDSGSEGDSTISLDFGTDDMPRRAPQTGAGTLALLVLCDSICTYPSRSQSHENVRRASLSVTSPYAQPHGWWEYHKDLLQRIVNIPSVAQLVDMQITALALRCDQIGLDEAARPARASAANRASAAKHASGAYIAESGRLRMEVDWLVAAKESLLH